ncbi:CLUMA_CG005283, isoform A [Clunio marinus]|uniref:CLUMA_CG005283, isoform A n=1 Tax=Clunio marinus TaxID=568069 RepID=A0A1J1HU81_9DIPT|nr:CLUMA_CG005283, isoform A [Clunio marinus]
MLKNAQTHVVRISNSILSKRKCLYKYDEIKNAMNFQMLAVSYLIGLEMVKLMAIIAIRFGHREYLSLKNAAQI